MLPESERQVSSFAAELAKVIEMPELPGNFHCTDTGNAQLFAKWNANELKYCHKLACWLVWDGRRWKRDEDGAVHRIAQDFIRRLYAEAAKLSDDQQRRAIASWALRCEDRRRIDSLLALARNQSELIVSVDDLDADGFVLNVLDGTIDLRTGELRPHDAAGLITKLAPVVYHDDSAAPIFHKFINRIFCGDAEIIRFVQRSIGYSATGDVSEQCFYLCHGDGENGKSKLFGIVKHVLGEYAVTTPTETLLAKREAGGVPNDIAKLKGARFVEALESDEGKRLAEARLKALTGGDKITARFMRSEWFEFDPTFKLWLATNHKPDVRGTDHAIWRRIRLVPFTARIGEEERDPQILEKLITESAGILKWIVAGCLDWKKNGLRPPQAVAEATAAYRAESDLLGAFLDDCCITGEGCESRAAALYSAYRGWTERNGQSPANITSFGRQLARQQFKKEKRRDGWHYLGIGLQP